MGVNHRICCGDYSCFCGEGVVLTTYRSVDGDFRDISAWKAAQTDCKRQCSGMAKAMETAGGEPHEGRSHATRSGRDGQYRNHDEETLTPSVGTAMPMRAGLMIAAFTIAT